MVWPAFDLGETINQTISATVTVVGVVVGGWIAFRVGIRQLRSERAIDRRIESLEKLLAAVGEYRGLLQFLISKSEERAEVNSERSVLDYRIREATDLGREVGRLARHAEPYATSDERVHRRPLHLAEFAGYIAIQALSAKSARLVEQVARLRRVVSILQEQERVLLQHLRNEMALPASRF